MTAATRTQLTKYEQARIAMMRFGMGPKRHMPAGDYTDGKWLERCEAELAVNAPNYYSREFLNDRDAAALGGNDELAGVNFRAERRARYRAHLNVKIGFSERLVLFWMNHFSMFYHFSATGTANAGITERNVIRRYAFGTFESMLISMCQNPVMLSYLDGRRSTKDRTTQNFAREILELHTLGSNGARGGVDKYTEDDVRNLAKSLTGWSFRHGPSDDVYIVPKSKLPGNNWPGNFIFKPQDHDPTPARMLVGERFNNYSGAEGVQQGIDALRHLARKRETAEHIAKRMAMYFVADAPSASLVKAIADSFDKNKEGNLRETARAMLTHDDAWTAPVSRIQQPYVWFMSVLRALGIPLDRLDVVAWAIVINGKRETLTFQQIIENYITLAGQELWTWRTPDGFPLEDAYWRNGNALRIRANVVYQMLLQLRELNFPIGLNERADPPVGRVAAPLGARPAPWVPPNAWHLAKFLFGDGASTATKRAVGKLANDNDRALALLFTSPEFLLR
jgi:uncharacterized protein (DUF1800 family)